MVDKYKDMKRNIYRYVQNRLNAYATTSQIATELANNFKIETIFHNTNKEMIVEFCEVLVDHAKWLKENYKYSKENTDGRKDDSRSSSSVATGSKPTRNN